MTVRRVVTGHDAEGRSVLVEDTAVDPLVVAEFPDFQPHQMWAVDDTATVPAAALPPAPEYFPPVNGVRFQVIVFPPAAPDDHRPDPADDPLMHVTDTVDYVYIAGGEVSLALDDDTEVVLAAGDTVVQQGTRHAWRNRSTTQRCVVVGVAVGAHRAG